MAPIGGYMGDSLMQGVPSAIMENAMKLWLDKVYGNVSSGIAGNQDYQAALRQGFGWDSFLPQSMQQQLDPTLAAMQQDFGDTMTGGYNTGLPNHAPFWLSQINPIQFAKTDPGMWAQIQNGLSYNQNGQQVWNNPNAGNQAGGGNGGSQGGGGGQQPGGSTGGGGTSNQGGGGGGAATKEEVANVKAMIQQLLQAIQPMLQGYTGGLAGGYQNEAYTNAGGNINAQRSPYQSRPPYG